ncbi:dTDP-4-dehydrorhamnose 3,5-epimerase [hydrothermal vent metagenome]|uniref:dTDP-4-dehydrorhamnose 3,5-epimerase n=1 Tax=hydrothermal vent metagenome TaxID=652676 RepID=A0A3B1C636_9ZZZZ
MDLIEGVRLKALKPIPDERGRLMEIIRCDDEIFSKFGQVYMTTAYPGVVKAWHFHQYQDDYFTVLSGMMKIVLYDGREDSVSHGKINEFFLGVYNQQVLKIPSRVVHGFKCISETEAMVLNVTTEPYNYKEPDEQRIDPHTNHIDYDWNREDG